MTTLIFFNTKGANGKIISSSGFSDLLLFSSGSRQNKKGTANKRNFFELAPSRAPGQSDYVICSDFETPSRGEMGPLTETRLHTEGKVEHEDENKDGVGFVID